jgi:IPT/TIG domain
MSAKFASVAFQNLDSPPPSGSLQTFDGYFSALPAKTYTINLTHEVVPPGQSSQSYAASQTVVVQAPEFAIDTTIVESVFPPNGGSGVYAETLPFIVLADPALPWERNLDPSSSGAPGPSNPTPWLALLVFAEGEIYLQPATSSPVLTSTVANLLATQAGVLKPQLPQSWVSKAVLASQCQTITITGAAFQAVLPSVGELPYLAHCRAVSTEAESQALLSVLLANRLPVAGAGPTAIKYYAHLVSLEGFSAYLGPSGQPLPSKPSGGLADVQLVSLYSWTFTSLPSEGQSFKQLVGGLIQSQQATAVLALPVPKGASLPASTLSRLQDGYAPLAFVAGSGEQSFAWYRGPLSPVVPQPLPQVGDGFSVSTATTADALLIYLAEQGLFDLSYAAAWNIGRALALADAAFAEAINASRLATNGALSALSQKSVLPHLSGEVPASNLMAPDAARRGFARRMADGLGQRWTAALTTARVSGSATATAPPGSRRMRSTLRRVAPTPQTMLEQPGVSAALGQNLQEQTEAVAAWLARLRRLEMVPFSHLVPNPAMLPVESIRFFYVDQGWLDALAAGATSIALHHSGDAAALSRLSSDLDAAVRRQHRNLSARPAPAGSTQQLPATVAMTGVLIRSQVVADWPAMVVSASMGGAPVTVVRDEVLSPTVRLCLFQGVPDTVTLAEPYQGLQFGVEDASAIYPRAVTAPAAVGAELTNVAPVTATFRTAPSGGAGGVLNVQPLAAALASAAGVTPFVAGAVVQWNGTALTTTYVNGNQLTAQVPASALATPGEAVVTVLSGGTTSAAASFLISPPFVLDTVSPAVVRAGGAPFTLTVLGEGFATGAVASWNGTALATSVVSVTQLSAAVPAALIAAIGSASITVQVGGSTTNSVTLPIVSATPTIESITPNVTGAGDPGFTLFVYGSELGTDAVVQWNGAALQTTCVNSGAVTAAVPASLVASAGSVSITVVSGGATSNAVAFTVATTTPTIGRINPTVAMAGGGQITLTVDGVNFGSDSVVSWNGTALATTVDNPEQVTANVPASLLTTAGSASVTVTSRSVVSNALSCTIVAPQSVIGLLEPSIAVAGSAAFTLTVFGGFGAGSLAIQLVKAPESQSFIPQQGARTP